MNAPNQRYALSLVKDLGDPLPGANERLLEVARLALADEESLNMCEWHTCETTHCIAGWAIHLDGTRGRHLENRYGSAGAGYLLLGMEAASHFFDYQEQALAYLKSVVEAAEEEERTQRAAVAAEQADLERQLLTAADRNPSLCQ